MSRQISIKARDKKTWPAWNGDPESLRKVVAAVDSFFASDREASLKKIRATFEAKLNKVGERLISIAELDREIETTRAKIAEIERLSQSPEFEDDNDIETTTEESESEEDFGERDVLEALDSAINLKRTEEKLLELDQKLLKHEQELETKQVLNLLGVKVAAIHRDLEHTIQGDPEAVIAQVEPEHVERMTIEGGSRYRESKLWIEVEFQRSPGVIEVSGCTLTVGGQDANLVRSAIAVVGAQIEKGVPRWGWLRTRPGRIGYSAIMSLLTIGVLARALIPRVNEETGQAIANLLMIGLLASFGCFSWLIPRLFPGFEISQVPGQSQGKRIIAIVGTFLLGVVGNVVANWLQ